MANDLYQGAAWYYARYRPDYPDAIIRDIVHCFALTKNNRVLDMGSGTGQLAAQLASHVHEVIAVEPDLDMMREGEQRCADRSVENIRWVHADAEHLDLRLITGPITVVTFGASFHWMDQRRVLASLSKIISRGGGVAVVGSQTLWNNPAPWELVVKRIIEKHLGAERRAGSGTYQSTGEPFLGALRMSDFSQVEEHSYAAERRQTIDGVVGLLLSTSFANPGVLGAKKDAFVRDVRSALTHDVGEEGVLVKWERYYALFAKRPT